MDMGIVGLPNVGKSTLFNALTSGHAASSNYPFTTIEPNVGIVLVPDARLNRLVQIFSPAKVTPTAIRFVDIAGLVKGASQGEGLGNQFLANIREVDAIVQVVRLFDDEEVIHTLGTVDPLRDAEVIETELVLADLQSATKQAEKLGSKVRGGDKVAVAQMQILEVLLKVLNEGKPARLAGFSREELKPLGLLTDKPVLYAGNGNESETPAQKQRSEQMQKFSQERRAEWIEFCGKLEAELSQLSTEEEKQTFRNELGIVETGLEKLIKKSYQLLGLVTFFTAGPQETRAWTVERGSTAVDAAAKIHTDIAKGFIKADIYSYKDIDELGSEKAIQEKGLKRSEGRDYIIKDGDVCYFHFR